MNHENVFPAVYDDAGPAGLVDMLLGLHATLTTARTHIDELARNTAADLPESCCDQLINVLLGVVSLAGTVKRVVTLDETYPATAAEPDLPARHEGLLR